MGLGNPPEVLSGNLQRVSQVFPRIYLKRHFLRFLQEDSLCDFTINSSEIIHSNFYFDSPGISIGMSLVIPLGRTFDRYDF